MESLRLSQSIQQIRSQLEYCHKTGRFTWKTGRLHGRQAGRVGSDGYTYIRVNGINLSAHRIAWAHFHGSWPEHQIDHINGAASDNRIENLRDVTVVVNQQNQRRARKDNKSGLLGVAFDSNKKSNPYQAFIRHGGKQRYLGCFPSAALAHDAYLAAKRELHPGCTI